MRLDELAQIEVRASFLGPIVGEHFFGRLHGQRIDEVLAVRVDAFQLDALEQLAVDLAGRAAVGGLPDGCKQQGQQNWKGSHSMGSGHVMKYAGSDCPDFRAGCRCPCRSYNALSATFFATVRCAHTAYHREQLSWLA